MGTILDAVHLEGVFPTHTSHIFDLNNGIIYLYYFHNYNKVVELNLEDEFAKGPHRGLISDLFLEESKIAETQTTGMDMNTIGLIVVIIILIAIVAFFITKRKKS